MLAAAWASRTSLAPRLAAAFGTLVWASVSFYVFLAGVITGAVAFAIIMVRQPHACPPWIPHLAPAPANDRLGMRAVLSA